MKEIKNLWAFLLVILVLTALAYCKKDKKSSAGSGTCSDGVKNQNEINVDCGGLCSACQTCSDGIQNQGEAGIDCGGPCGKCPVVYPQNGFYGKNIIWPQSGANFRGSNFPAVTGDTTFWYSIAAKLPSGTSLKVRLTSLSSNNRPWFYDLSSQGTWKVNLPADSIQEFYNSEQANPDLKIMFTNSGSAKIEVYENDANDPLRSKTIYWDK